MNVYAHTHSPTNTHHTHIHTHAHTHLYAHTPTHMHTHTFMHTHTCTRPYPHTCAHKLTHPHAPPPRLWNKGGTTTHSKPNTLPPGHAGPRPGPPPAAPAPSCTCGALRFREASGGTGRGRDVPSTASGQAAPLCVLVATELGSPRVTRRVSIHAHLPSSRGRVGGLGSTGPTPKGP